MVRTAQHIRQLPTALSEASGDQFSTIMSGRQSDGAFEDLYLFANLVRQSQSLRMEQPLLDKLLHYLLAYFSSDAAFLHLPDHPRFSKLLLTPDMNHSQDGPKMLSQFREIIPASLRKARKGTLFINNSHADATFESLSERPYRLIAASVRYQKKRYGWLGLIAFNRADAFNQHVLKIIKTTANQLSVMLANMIQYDTLEAFTLNIVSSLVCAIEAKDRYARGHSERVHRYAIKMARHMHLDPSQIEALRWSAILHDIGKIGIPERILLKPSKLTRKEFALIKKHPLKGGAILKPIKQLRPAIAGIIYHHERYNGTGYPKRLRGDNIPLAARIIAVVDTFDAITSPRSYRKRKTIKEAMLMLDQVAGTQLDPYLVRIFKTVYRQHRKDKKAHSRFD